MRKLSAASILIVIIILAGCSGNAVNPVEPAQNPPTTASESEGGRYLWGMWEFRLDEATQAIDAVPVRSLDAHYNVASMILPPNCNDCVVVDLIYFAPFSGALEVDVTLRNPYPISGRDVRGILYTDDAGIELFCYDGWTALHDIPGGSWINPFIAYAKTETNRIFAADAEHTENFNIHFDGSILSHQLLFAVDASWPGNCREPYEIKDQVQSILYDSVGASAKLRLQVNDWQFNANKVTLVCPIITGEDFTQFTEIGCGGWQLNLVNNNGALPGYYEARIIAASSDSPSVAMYQMTTIHVAPTPDGYVQAWGGTDGFDDAYDVAYSSAGFVYVVGRFKGAVDFDPGVFQDYRFSNGDTDCFLAQFDKNGELKWVRAWGGPSNDIAVSVAVDYSGYILVAGSFKETVDFEPGAGIDNHTSNGVSDIFLCKYSANGDFLWAKTWGSTEIDGGSGIATDYYNNIYVCGYYQDTCDFDPGAGTYNGTSNGGYDIFLSKFQPSGNFSWAVAVGGTAFDMAYDTATDDAGNVFLVGYFADIVDFNPGIGVNNRLAVGYDAFLARYTDAGEFSGVTSWGGLDDAKAYAIDSSGSILCITGIFDGTCDFNPDIPTDNRTSKGGNDVFVTRYATTFEYQWTRTWGSTGDDFGNDIDVDADGNIYTAGMYQLTCDFDPGAGTDSHMALGSRDAFLSKLDSFGALDWCRTWGGTEWDTAQGCIVGDSSNAVYTVGSFNDVVDFQPGTGITNKTSNGDEDSYLLKMQADGTW